MFSIENNEILKSSSIGKQATCQMKTLQRQVYITFKTMISGGTIFHEKQGSKFM